VPADELDAISLGAVHRPSIVLVTPALADANNGNWQTARRWSRMLAPACRVSVAGRFDAAGQGDHALMIALHARRSAPSIAAWRERHPGRPLLVVLTGTDLYRDIDTDASAQRSLALADRLVVLNERGALRLPEALRPRCSVVLQSCPARRTLPKTRRHLRVLMVGHLRDEKDPLTYMAAARRLSARPDILFDHVGAAFDPALGDAARQTAQAAPGYRWLGALDHAATRRRIQAAHLLVHASRMEGGAHVVIEALRSGTPVLASRIDGNLGLLGADWPATFEVGDAAALAAMIGRARDEAALLAALQAKAALRAPLFAPAAEAAALRRIVDVLLGQDRA
jgi:putative glycosyltransferase (TIGR04348 family)